MPQIIPKQYERGVVLVKSLSDSDISRIVEALSGAGPAVDQEGILAIIRQAVPGIKDADAETLADTLYSLYLFIGHSDLSMEGFLHELSESTATTENQQLRTSSADERAGLRNRLKSLLTVRPLTLLSKADGLRHEAAYIFSDARIISDIRPVWNGDATQPPEGIVIAQTLKIVYYDVTGTKEIYLNIDNDDIEALLFVLERAQEKASTLTALAEGTWMRILK